MALRIVHKQKIVKVDTRAVRGLVGAVLDEYGRADSDVTVLFADDSFLHKLNLEYRGIDGTTDVLSFAMMEGDESTISPDVESVLGDVMISVERAAVQARRYRKPVGHEILKLVAHGVLHLIGFDHASTSERNRMRRIENRHLKAVLDQA
ncbi:rRNA maturation RNase YbeY [bacterium]|nr:rRNA maturation RNase YbeY [bacterium]